MHLNLDERLILEAQAVGRHKTKEEAVMTALQEYVARKKQLGVLKLTGKIEFDPYYQYKKARRR